VGRQGVVLRRRARAGERRPDLAERGRAVCGGAPSWGARAPAPARSPGQAGAHDGRTRGVCVRSIGGQARARGARRRVQSPARPPTSSAAVSFDSSHSAAARAPIQLQRPGFGGHARAEGALALFLIRAHERLQTKRAASVHTTRRARRARRARPADGQRAAPPPPSSAPAPHAPPCAAAPDAPRPHLLSGAWACSMAWRNPRSSLGRGSGTAPARVPAAAAPAAAAACCVSARGAAGGGAGGAGGKRNVDPGRGFGNHSLGCTTYACAPQALVSSPRPGVGPPVPASALAHPPAPPRPPWASPPWAPPRPARRPTRGATPRRAPRWRAPAGARRCARGSRARPGAAAGFGAGRGRSVSAGERRPGVPFTSARTRAGKTRRRAQTHARR
jgi:hypothetical protein